MMGANDEYIEQCTGRTGQVRVHRPAVYTVADCMHQSDKVALDVGVPQGSVLVPLLFAVYCRTVYLDLSCSSCTLFNVLVIGARHGVAAHSYADDTQLYLHSCDN